MPPGQDNGGVTLCVGRQDACSVAARAEARRQTVTLEAWKTCNMLEKPRYQRKSGSSDGVRSMSAACSPACRLLLVGRARGSSNTIVTNSNEAAIRPN
jgi:hypothetical protein